MKTALDLLTAAPGRTVTTVTITNDDPAIRADPGREAAAREAQELIRAIRDGRAVLIDQSGSI